MIDPRRERLIRLADVPKLDWLPRRSGGGRLHLSTLYRWVQRGLRGLRLETIQCGGTRCTTEAALLRFFGALGKPVSDPYPTAAPRLRSQYQRAERLLDEAGIK